ncbi:MAG: zf-HC2 domain-containing protein, partial [Desulfobacteraceae bacterium]|nr:zf-HC2 domain-containing protein [Desulfobacteraceae bacterium]
MGKTCKTYDQKIISQFIDNELPSEKHKLISEHIEICPICKDIAEKYLHMSDAFIQNTSRQVDKFDTTILRQNVIEQIKREENGLFKKVFDYFS